MGGRCWRCLKANWYYKYLINKYYWPQMATVVKKEKGLNKHSFRGLTPDQVNELTQEQVVELFRARMRRRFSRSTSSITQKSNTNISDFTLSAKSQRRTHNQERSQFPLRLTSETLSSCQKWSATTSQSTMAKASTMWKSSSTWSVAISENSVSPTNLADTVKPVSEPPRDPHILPLNDLYNFKTLSHKNILLSIPS